MSLPRTKVHKARKVYGPHEWNRFEMDNDCNKSLCITEAPTKLDVGPPHKFPRLPSSSTSDCSTREVEKSFTLNHSKGVSKRKSGPSSTVRQSNQMCLRCPVTRVRNNASTDLSSRFTGGDTSCQSGRHGHTCADETRPCTVKSQIQVNISEIKWHNSNCNLEKSPFENHLELQKKHKKSSERAIQTRYREFSTQTVPYLPPPANKDAELDDLEIFRVSTILPGDGPPGLYEVEVFERARRRWEFTKALKCLQESGNEKVVDKKKFKTIVEAFEWENWIQREEYLQECQELRFEMVAQMFEERKRSMRLMSQKRLEKAAERIAVRHEAAIKKIKTEYGRRARRLEAERCKKNRNYRQEAIVDLLTNPTSDFHAPQIRYGVNPKRRHFIERGRFEERMLLLEKEIIKNKRIECPFAKLNKWSAPKQAITEIQQNFCSDKNLKKLYEKLRDLRLATEHHKTRPKCLIIKQRISEETVSPKPKPVVKKRCPGVKNQHVLLEIPTQSVTEKDSANASEMEEFCRQVLAEKERALKIAMDNRQEELDYLIADYEGTMIGYLMEFLGQESDRADELKELKLLNTVALKERSRREAAEAGLRQKEHHMREKFELLYHHSDTANIKKATGYVKENVDDFAKEEAEMKAVRDATKLAQSIDVQIGNWLKSVKVIQNPQNYYALRRLIKDIMFPELEAIIKRFESQQIAGSVIDKVLLPKVKKAVEGYDVSYPLTSDTVDRLIDNDLLLFSKESGIAGTDGDREAQAILRKTIRRAVPGDRWKTPAGREIIVQVDEFLDEMFKALEDEAVKSESKRWHDQQDLLSNASVSDLSTPVCKAHRKGSQRRVGEVLEEPSVLLETTTYQPYRDSNDESLRKFTRSLRQISLKSMIPLGYPPDKVQWGYEPLTTISLLEYLENQQEITEDDQSFHIPHKTIEYDGRSTESILTIKKEVITYSFIKELISRIISKFIPADDNDFDEYDLLEEEAEEEQKEELQQNLLEEEMPLKTDSSEDDSNETADTAARAILKKILKHLPSNTVVESEGIEEENEYELELTKQELASILNQKCKCRMEKDKEQYVRELMKRGKLKILPDLNVENEEELYGVEENYYDEDIETQFDYSDENDYDEDIRSSHEDEFTEETFQTDVVEQPHSPADIEEVTQPQTNAITEVAAVAELAGPAVMEEVTQPQANTITEVAELAGENDVAVESKPAVASEPESLAMTQKEATSALEEEEAF